MALAHDLGHTPFGHAGEEALALCMAEYGGFEHNEQTIRILTMLEHRYASFDGLNLSWETLEGVVKHNGPIIGKAQLRPAISQLDAAMSLELSTFASAEAQLANLADDIAYLSHDFDDALRAGLFDIADIAHLPQVDLALARIERRYGKIERGRLDA